MSAAEMGKFSFSRFVKVNENLINMLFARDQHTCIL